jgi:hypothetical protein
MGERIVRQPESQVPLTLVDVIRRLEWRTELLTVALIAAEASLVWLLAGLVMPETSSKEAYPFWIIAFVLLAAHYVTHLLDQARIWSPDYEIIMATSVVLTLLITLKAASFPTIPIYDPEWLGGAINALALFDTEQVRPVWGNVVLVVYAWWRGRARDEPSLDSAYTMLRWGTMALAILLILILIAAPQDVEIRDQLSIGTLGFFIAALAAIGLARMQLEGFRAAGPLGPRWLATFATPILAIIAIAVIGAGIFSRQFLETMLWLLSPVLFVLSIIFQIIVLVFAIIAFLILTPIFWLIGDLEVSTENPTATPSGELGETAAEQAQPEQFVIPEALQYLIAAIVLVAIISLLTRYLFRRRARRRQPAFEERESVLDWSDVFGSMGNRLRSLFAREPGFDPYAGLRSDERWRYTIRVRERYGDLQRRGAELGRARQARETAEEYRPAVGNRLALDGKPAVDGMTSIYRRARYSGTPASKQDADRMDDFWKRADSAASNAPDR